MNSEDQKPKRDIVPDILTFLLFGLAVFGCVVYVGYAGTYQYRFVEANLALPTATKLYLVLSLFCRTYWYAIFAGLGALSVGLLCAMRGRSWPIFAGGAILAGLLTLGCHFAVVVPGKKVTKAIEMQRRHQPPSTTPDEPGT